MKKNQLFALALCLVLVMSMLAGCSSKASTDTAKADAANTNAASTDAVGESASFDISKAKIALVLPGSIDDQSWNASKCIQK